MTMTTTAPPPPAGSAAPNVGPVFRDPDADGGADPLAALSPPDPNITFDWRETQPGQGQCQPGTYTGTFTCVYAPAGVDPAEGGIEVTGPIALTLTKSQNGEFLEIADGQLDGLAMLVFGFRAKLSGQLDCSTDQLTATAVGGMYGFGDPDLAPIGTFDGTLAGMLDRQSVTLSGDWTLTEGSGGACIGPWSATWTP